MNDTVKKSSCPCVADVKSGLKGTLCEAVYECQNHERGPEASQDNPITLETVGQSELPCGSGVDEDSLLPVFQNASCLQG